jgi:hypothetical protein
MRNVRTGDFFAWCLSFCFAGVALAASAQSQNPGPIPIGPVEIPPDATVQQQPPTDAWDRRGIQKVSQDDDWTRHFRIGAMVGLNINANFNFNAKGSLNVNRPAGVYDDGYVRKDNTGNVNHQTSYWGYDHNSQYDAGSQELTMHNTTSFTTSGGSESRGSAFAGFDMAYGGNIWNWRQTRIGWELGFGLLPIDITDNRPMSVTSIKQSTLVFDTSNPYNAPIPAAPYQQGPIWVPGEGTIGATPKSVSSGTTLTPGPGDTWTLTGSRTLDVMLYTVRLGPSVYWDLNEHLGLSAGAGPAVGIVSGSYKFNETVNAGDFSAQNKGKIDATDLVYGGYANAMLLYHVPGENGDLYLGAQFMSLGNATISGGGRQGQLNLGGQIYITAGINWPF